MDGIDPADTPGTGSAEGGGITPREARQRLQGLMGLDVVGGDGVEAPPQHDANTNTAQVGGQLLFEVSA